MSTFNYTKNSNYAEILFLSFISLLIFYYWQGLNILNIFDINWLLSGDYMQNQASFVMYRYSDFNFPIGDISNTDYPVRGNIIFSDGNLFLSLIGKILFFLPPNIQLYGWWILLCLVLQFLSAWWLLKQLNVDRPTRLLGAIIIGLYPAFLYRLMHLNLLPHFIIILSVGLYFSSFSIEKKIRLLNILLIFSLFVHFYFVPMVLAFIVLILFEEYLQKKISFIVLLAGIGKSILLMLGFMYILGYFSGFDPHISGFGKYSMNLNAPFNSLDRSPALKGMALGSRYQKEGFQYFGIGYFMLLLSLMATKNAFTNFKTYFTKYLVFFIIIFTILSLSYKWYFGSFLILEFKLSREMINLFSPIRSSGRYFWVVGYLIISITIAALYFSHKQTNKKQRFYVLLMIAIALQLYDLKPLWKQINSTKSLKVTFPSSYMELSKILENKGLYGKPIFIHGKWNEMRYKIVILVSLAGDKIFSIGPWPHVRKTLRFDNPNPAQMYWNYVKKNSGIYITDENFPSNVNFKCIYRSPVVNAYQFNSP